MDDLLQSGDGVIRCADAVMRAVGGRTVLLRLPAPAVPGNDAEQLGLATPEFQDIELGPATFHKANSVAKLLVSASAVHAALGSLAYDSADVLFETAVGVLIDDVMYEITNSFASQAMGKPYCYWLTLVPPVR
jgi:hypothetical protein